MYVYICIILIWIMSFVKIAHFQWHIFNYLPTHSYIAQTQLHPLQYVKQH